MDDNFRPTHDASRSGAKAFFKDINKILDQGGMQMELKSLKDEMDQGKEVWALVCFSGCTDSSHNRESFLIRVRSTLTLLEKRLV